MRFPPMETPSDAVGFYQGVVFAGKININPDLGFLKKDGVTSAFKRISNEKAQTLQKMNDKAIAILKWNACDAWEIAMWFSMLKTYHAYIKDDPQSRELLDEGHLRSLEEMLTEDSVIAQGCLDIKAGTETEERKESRRTGFMLDCLTKLMGQHPLVQQGKIGSSSTGGMWPSDLFPHGWADIISAKIVAEGGSKHTVQSAVGDIEDKWHEIQESAHGNIDPDSEDNDDDPFGFDLE